MSVVPREEREYYFEVRHEVNGFITTVGRWEWGPETTFYDLPPGRWELRLTMPDFVDAPILTDTFRVAAGQRVEIRPSLVYDAQLTYKKR